MQAQLSSVPVGGQELLLMETGREPTVPLSSFLFALLL